MVHMFYGLDLYIHIVLRISASGSHHPICLEDKVYIIEHLPYIQAENSFHKESVSLLLHSALQMDATSTDNQVATDCSPFFRIYKDGRVERLTGTEIIPTSTDPNTGVKSKDVQRCPQENVSARIFLPKITNPDKKLPLLVYFHGGAFIIESPYSPLYHPYGISLVSEANVIAVSVDYRLAPEHPLPTAYEDSWAAINWITSHKDGNGPEEWLNLHADFERMYFAGDSAGANIAHHMGKRVQEEGLIGDGINLEGILLVHPYFWGKDPIGKEKNAGAGKREILDALWRFACPTTSGCDDPFINPDFDLKMSSLGCKRVLVCVAEKDLVSERGKTLEGNALRNNITYHT